MNTAVEKETAPDHIRHDRLHRGRWAARQGRTSGKALVELAATRPEIVGMTADRQYTDLHLFRAGLPRALLPDGHEICCAKGWALRAAWPRKG